MYWLKQKSFMRIDRDRLHLLHIRDAIAKIEEYVQDTTFDEFADQGRTYDAIMLQFIVIGEAINDLSSQFKEQHAAVPWHKPVGMRNQIAHGYFDVKPDIVWQTIQENVPELKKHIEGLV